MLWQGPRHLRRLEKAVIAVINSKAVSVQEIVFFDMCIDDPFQQSVMRGALPERRRNIRTPPVVEDKMCVCVCVRSIKTTI